MKILHTLSRHSNALARLMKVCDTDELKGHKFIILCVDGPESIDRRASYSSDFSPEDTAKILMVSADQMK